ncbi:DUF5819 family protein [Streptomyces sp. NPDC058391]|uniref:DUF5819 family protein n=1 Tax=Streptomyces sp. NPDC058391 TaxID=3346476 RepID=UPI00364B8050
MPSGVESTDVKEWERAGDEPAARERYEESRAPGGLSGLSGPLRAGLAVAVVLCLATSLVHVILVFLHVAPSNAVSQRYSQQVSAWVYPLFEQNWRLFAPDPESVNRQISARTLHITPDGDEQVSSWFDLTAVDDSAVEHDVFPSHTSQNMLRRAWTSYLELHGGEDQPRSERALMLQQYLRNIAVNRVAAHRTGAFESIQLRVLTLPIAPPGAGPATAAPAPVDTRYLPWWKVTSHGN